MNELFKDLIIKKRRYAARLKRSLEHHQSIEDRNYCLDELAEVESDIEIYENYEPEDEDKEADGDGKRETRDNGRQRPLIRSYGSTE